MRVQSRIQATMLWMSLQLRSTRQWPCCSRKLTILRKGCNSLDHLRKKSTVHSLSKRVQKQLSALRLCYSIVSYIIWKMIITDGLEQ
ncbi:unnamed protein product [Heterosigma akashiwo]